MNRPLLPNEGRPLPVVTPLRRYDESAAPEARAGLAVITLFFGVFGIWAAFVPLDAAVMAAGEVKVSGNSQVIQHREGGIISRVAVSEGDHVRAGQLLIELSASELLAQEQALASETIEYQASRERLIAEQEGRRTLTAPAVWSTLPDEYRDLAQSVLERSQGELVANLDSTGSRVSVLGQRQLETDARIRGYQEQIAAIDQQSTLINAELDGLRDLAREGFAAETRVRAVERSASELVGRRAELTALIAQSRESIGETRIQSISTRQDRATQIAEELRTTDTRLAEVAPRWQAIREQLESTRVRAPVDGRVVGLAFFNAGAVVRPGDRILELVPDDRRMVMEVKVRPQDADDLHAGQTTLVRFNAFEGRQKPYAHGRVHSISADRFEDSRSGQNYFLAEIDVDSAEMARLSRAAGRTLVLSPGLPVEAVIPLRKRTALQYLIEPMQQSLWRSFREH
jgi:HlyD family secretion protein